MSLFSDINDDLLSQYEYEFGILINAKPRLEKIFEDVLAGDYEDDEDWLKENLDDDDFGVMSEFPFNGRFYDFDWLKNEIFRTLVNLSQWDRDGDGYADIKFHFQCLLSSLPGDNEPSESQKISILEYAADEAYSADAEDGAELFTIDELVSLSEIGDEKAAEILKFEADLDARGPSIPVDELKALIARGKDLGWTPSLQALITELDELEAAAIEMEMEATEATSAY